MLKDGLRPARTPGAWHPRGVPPRARTCTSTDLRSTALYDALLDELDDDVTSHTDEIDLADKADDESLELDDDDELIDLGDDIESGAEAEEESSEDEEPLAGEEGESWSDDPVRMYLTQMGEIPLLTRQQEIALARQIEATRARFRRKVLDRKSVV